MARGTPELRQIVANNLQALMDRRAWSQTEVAAKANISQRQISNMLSCSTGASYETLHAIAGAFGIPGWAMLLEKLPVELLDSQKIPLLVASFRDAGPDGQELVGRLADREAVHNREKTKVLPLKKSITG